MQSIRVGLVGYGYWGPNIAKNLDKISKSGIDDISVSFDIIIDSDEKNRNRATVDYGRPTGNNVEEFYDKADAFFLATPIHTHYNIAKFLIEHGKHVIIQKPMCASYQEAQELVDLAAKNNVKVMTAHTFLYSPPIRKIKELIDSGELGDLNYISSTRINLGLFQRGYNVVWDLAPHDFSIIRYLFDKPPEKVFAHGQSHTDSNLIDCVSVDLSYGASEKFTSNIHINWLSPIKVRNMIIGGSDKTVLYDDCDIDKIKIYDSKVEYSNDVFSYRKGDILSPRLDTTEPIFFECKDFIEHVVKDKEPISNNKISLDVMKMLEISQVSLNSGKFECL